MDTKYHECRHKDMVIFHPISEDCNEVYKAMKLIPVYKQDEEYEK